VLGSALGRSLLLKRRVARALYAPPRPRVLALLWLLAGLAPQPLKYAVGAALGVLPASAPHLATPVALRS
jgi:hypothetical protein